MAKLALTPTSVVIMAPQDECPPLTCNLADISTIGITWAGGRDSGVTLTRRDGRVARFLFKPDQKLVRELELLGATVTSVN
ncbi:MAG: hypothetical protein LC792_27145 [Actinobacteria bacterium]|nr:hypothetical protein [Actinomycetota bacterium]